MPKIKNSLTVNVPIADTLLKGIDVASAEKLQAALKEQGVHDGIPVNVEVVPKLHWYEATATWEQ